MQLQGAYDKAKASAEEYFSPPSATDSLKTGAADAYAKAKVRSLTFETHCCTADHAVC